MVVESKTDVCRERGRRPVRASRMDDSSTMIACDEEVI